MGSPKFFGERPSVEVVSQWLAASQEKFFLSICAIQVFMIEKIEGLNIHVVTHQMIPGCCGLAAPTITEALRKKGCSDASTVSGLFKSKREHAWTQVSLGGQEHVIDATYSQFVYQEDRFRIYPVTELSQQHLVQTSPHPEYNDPWENHIQECYRQEMRRLVHELLASLL